MSSLTIWTLAISAWGVLAPLAAWSMGKQAGADEFRRSYLATPCCSFDRTPTEEHHMNRKSRTTGLVIAIIAALAILTGCQHKSDTVSQNISKDADSYKVFRQIVVYNGITDKYILEVDGWCALGNDDPANEVSYTCKVQEPDGSTGYVKDIINRSDNTFVYEHQLTPSHVSDTYFRVILRPETIVPDIQFQ